MRNLLTQLGTALHPTLVSLAIFAGCAASHHDAPVPDAEVRADGAAADEGGADASTHECESAADCRLDPAACCGSCAPTTSDFVARPLTEPSPQLCAGGVNCGPCAVTPHDPLAPVPFATCEAHRCVVRDLRGDDATACASDEDCRAEPRGCCTSCDDAPEQWLSVSGDNPAAADCQGVGCPMCMGSRPEAFCAADGHCAVRSRCFGPDSNLETAYEPGAFGCPCVDASAEMCVEDDTGRLVALVCADEIWIAVEDGPCAR